ncbi:DUF3368 domain-containing protein [Gloeobacter violaceus]|uniref:Glr0616 protein n=1 Tax=Gloeobacter violaceus (strain ATCC 29082 / PCC 7421) TaxID=251221 RepID=Q7NMZ9_GLOVI|nr:DUF3368 domain-containing protein [Gloeobacter violaceus]BAC88557.1 glr0616 [Gloeobacter violaceus PCC 7421]
MPEVIADTSPLQYLYQAEILDLLRLLYGYIVLPQAVADELAAGRTRRVTLPDPASILWMSVRRVLPTKLLQMTSDLGAGEREVLALAVEMPGSLVLLDDGLARRYARLLNLQLAGTLGVLLKAKQEKHINAVKPAVDRLEALGFRLAPSTRAAVLELAEEV